MKFTHKTGLAAAMASVMVIGAVAVTSSNSAPVQADAGESESGVFPARQITVHMDPNCGCCGGWAEHLAEQGYDVTGVYTDQLMDIKSEYQVPSALGSCHTAVVDGLVVEGHVPIDAIERFLTMEEKPFGDRTVGIAVPGMPLGSPGMEVGRYQDFDALAFTADGETEVISEYRF